MRSAYILQHGNLAAQAKRIREGIQLRKAAEALGVETPAKIHEWSERAFPEVVKEWLYPSGMKVLYVTQNGAVRWKSFYWVYMTRGLIGKRVGAEEVGNGIWKIFYRDVFLGYFNEKAIRDKESLTRLSTNLV